MDPMDPRREGHAAAAAAACLLTEPASPTVGAKLPRWIIAPWACLLTLLHLPACVWGTRPPTFNVVVWGGGDQWSTVGDAARLAAVSVSAFDRFAFGLNVSVDTRLGNDDTDTNDLTKVFDAYRRARQLPGGLVGIIGPPFSSQLAGSSIVCALDRVPILSVTAGGTATTAWSSPGSFDTLFQLRQSNTLTARALAAVVLHYGWTQIGVVADSSIYARDMDAEIEFATGLGVTVLANTCDTEVECSTVLEELHNMRHVNVFVVLAMPAAARVILDSAHQLGLMSQPGVAWLGTDTLGKALSDMAPEAQAKFAGVAEVFPEPGGLAAETELLTTWLAHSPTTFPVSGKVPREALLAWDAVHALAHAIQAQQNSSSPSFQAAPVGLPGDTWAQGPNVTQALGALQFDGASGRVDFDVSNERVAVPHGLRFWNGQGAWTTALRLTNMVSGGSGSAQSRQASAVATRFVSVEEIAIPMWPGRTLAVPDGSGMTGMTLNVVVKQYIPYSIVDAETNTFSGFGVDILRQVAEEHGLRLEMRAAPVGGSTALIRDVVTAGNATGTLIDVGVGGFAIDGDRFTDPSTYSVPFSRFQLRIVVPKARNQKAVDIWGFLRPFGWEVWAACFGTVLVSAGLLFTFESGSAVRPGRSGVIQVLHESCNACMGGAGNMVDESKVRSSSAKLLFFSSRWFALVLLSEYTALLAANLVVTQSIRGIETWDDVADARVAVYGGGLSQRIAEGFHNNLKLIQAGKDYSDMIDAMLDLASGKLDAVLMNPIRAEYLIHHDPRLCDLEVIGEPQGTMPSGFIFRSTMSPAVVRAVDRTVTNLRSDAGTPLEELIKGYETRGDVCRPESAAEQLLNGAQQYRIEDLLGIFVFFYTVGLGVGIPLHFFEKYKKRGRFKVKKESRQRHKGQVETRNIELSVVAASDDDAASTPAARPGGASQPSSSPSPPSSSNRLARLALVRAKSRERLVAEGRSAAY